MKRFPKRLNETKTIILWHDDKSFENINVIFLIKRKLYLQQNIEKGNSFQSDFAKRGVSLQNERKDW